MRIQNWHKNTPWKGCSLSFVKYPKLCQKTRENLLLTPSTVFAYIWMKRFMHTSIKCSIMPCFLFRYVYPTWLLNKNMHEENSFILHHQKNSLHSLERTWESVKQTAVLAGYNHSRSNETLNLKSYSQNNTENSTWWDTGEENCYVASGSDQINKTNPWNMNKIWSAVITG